MSNLETILSSDRRVTDEMIRYFKSGRALRKNARNEAFRDGVRAVAEGNFDLAFTNPVTEAVIRDFLRPCLLVQNQSFSVPESDVWKSRLEPYRKMIERRLGSVGRIEFKNHPRFKWGGTGWLIAERFIVTNTHVAELFARKTAGGITMIQNPLGTIEAFIDFNEEYRTAAPAIQVGVEQVIYMADAGQPDVAILKLSPGAQVFAPIPLLGNAVRENAELAVIGYPAYDPYRNPLSAEDVTRIFGDVFECKRLAPGYVVNADDNPYVFTHDATTLGGNSGSVVLDLASGQAAGLHFSGEFHEANYAVKSHVLLDILSRTAVTVNRVLPPIVPPPPGETEAMFDEGPIDYSDREGYVADFIGNDVIIPLPQIRNQADVLRLTGTDETVLKYHHFSVEMSKARRMCIYSAVNIDGRLYRKTKRPAWRLDPRIPEDAQIIKECYGNPPRFSRGHMTRREDPAWGVSLEDGTLGNADSMHVTNAVPQMQTFNAGIWLDLEDYALQHTRQDKMRVSVFTGPFFTDKDPTRDDVRIPVDFWKVIAFIHDDTGKLCATGYIMSQESFLQNNEFVFGQHETYQTSIRAIEQRSGIRFGGGLDDADPYVGQEVAPVPLIDPTQIRFVR